MNTGRFVIRDEVWEKVSPHPLVDSKMIPNPND
jgi:hypothetical protein